MLSLFQHRNKKTLKQVQGDERHTPITQSPTLINYPATPFY
jgi:hypothetical protein